MDRDIQQLMELGATVAQARAALKQYKDVMQAAERILEGRFDDVPDDDGDVPMVPEVRKPQRPTTPAGDDMEDEDDELGDDAEDDEDDFVDYDSDYEIKAAPARVASDAADPYSGIFFSKDRREEVIEVEEDPELVVVPSSSEKVKLMTQGEWMKGCPEGGEQSFLFGLYSALTEGSCRCPHDCGFSIRRKKSDFFAIFPEVTAYLKHLQDLVVQKCPTCKLDFCFACGESISTDRRRGSATDDTEALFHCSNIQGVVLGVGLSMLEQVYFEQTQEPSSSSDSQPRNSKRRKMDTILKVTKLLSTNDDDDDVYYAGSNKKGKGGIGYAGEVREDMSGQLEAQALQKAKDEKIGAMLTNIRHYLPSLHRPGGARTSDYMVHPTALAHLRRRFNYICSSLLRNDSLADMSDRAVLYFELLEWLETISNHEALASMMAMPIMAVVSSKSLPVKKSNNTRIRERTITYEGSSSPRELLEAIAIQAQAALKGLEGMKPAEAQSQEMTEEQKRMTVQSKGKAKETAQPVSEENLRLLQFCQRILSTRDAIDRSLRDTKGDAFLERLHSSLPQVFTSSTNVTVDAGQTEESAQKAYIEWATRVRFEYCDLTVETEVPADAKDEERTAHYKFYYNNEARMLANSDIPKRSLAIAKELAILTTNLPVAWNSSIFLRVDETRVDVIKALITGPEGTPYYNGCYLFDIFLGPSYNQAPPSVKYMTTNGGKFRFNPNLYADGKVCLSLLGTWQGPGWVAGRSTLLQVLISIQSMILCEEPYLNEPGWASNGGTPQSAAYSANVRRMVVKTAMLGNLKCPPEPFEDIVRTHYRLKAQSIMKQLDEWLAKDDGRQTNGEGGYANGGRAEPGGSGNSMAKDIDELKQMLKDLQKSS
ncbi:hypothetical protein HGRIS_009968 [Hohenbuehelia grisea]|uniref:UBC core domain-containing protein n=1 Tax=Hohenbuehelia grisea TaxID=104357 RepID=A0ABR3J2T7_9AGAR